MTENIIPFQTTPGKAKELEPEKPKQEFIGLQQVQVIGLLTSGDVDYYIPNREDIAKIFRFIIANKIKILKGD